MKKKTISLLLALALAVGICPAAFAVEEQPISASESEEVEIKVNGEQDILEFIFSDEFDPHVKYSFVYPDSGMMYRGVRCPECGYNTLVGRTVEQYDLCHPYSQGMAIQCPDYPFATDAFVVMLVYGYQYCNTCGYKSTKTFHESKFYIDCTFNETSYVATDYKTEYHAGVSTHEWKTTWELYYDDPHYPNH